MVTWNRCSPEIPVPGPADGVAATKNVHNPAVSVRVNHVKGRHLQSPERRFERIEIRSAHHVPVLFDHMRFIETGDPRDQYATGVFGNHRAMVRTSDNELAFFQ